MVIPREPLTRGLRRDYTLAPQITKAYLLGVIHDASVRKTTFRIATRSQFFAEVVQKGIKKLDRKAWMYKEGKDRNLWIVEFSKSLLKGIKPASMSEKLDFIRGFFDAEGGIARSSKVRFYLYFCQKDKVVLEEIKKDLNSFGIESGIVHNPSRRVDPNYWRFFIRAKSYKKFAEKVSSAHPEKLLILRKKI